MISIHDIYRPLLTHIAMLRPLESQNLQVGLFTHFIARALFLFTTISFSQQLLLRFNEWCDNYER